MPQTILVKNTTTLDHPPATLANGELAAGLSDTPVRMWIGTPSGVKALGGVIVADAPPSASPNALWWDSSGGHLYIRFQSAWVEIP